MFYTMIKLDRHLKHEWNVKIMSRRQMILKFLKCFQMSEELSQLSYCSIKHGLAFFTCTLLYVIDLYHKKQAENNKTCLSYKTANQRVH
jgi:hypothetical protein